ncbi:TadE/TadG family type IV pilus assembly protein [Cognatishimia maritima]|uniref:TadE-like protein n=1 Tax=Cognatishimia maritima TaxID=870908 RepID=A0A1M5V9B2_9RHOB|nr:TadE family protein [Cognatishimia maritima]SHH71815.1 TadE-like protein [Cognatishimia maritima]
MKQRITQKLRNFRLKEDGNAAVEFVIMAPLLLILMLASVEIGMMTIRNSLLERAMDDTVRWVRLNTGAAPTHAELKTMICEYNVVPDCETNLQLEMLVRDLRSWEVLPASYTCTDRAEEILPMSEFSLGEDNELVVLRACAKFEPLFPNALFASVLSKDGAGDAALTYTTAFVQEPR